MDKITLKNDSQIAYVSSANDTVRSKRSELISFYCSICETIYEDYPIKDIQFIGEKYQICKSCFDTILGGFAFENKKIK